MILLIIIIGIIVYFVQRSKSKKHESEDIKLRTLSQQQTRQQQEGHNDDGPIYAAIKAEVLGVDKIEDVEVLEKLGSGNFGEVYRGVWQGTTFVALKRLTGDISEFRREASTLQFVMLLFVFLHSFLEN